MWPGELSAACDMIHCCGGCRPPRLPCRGHCRIEFATVGDSGPGPGAAVGSSSPESSGMPLPTRMIRCMSIRRSWWMSSMSPPGIFTFSEPETERLPSSLRSKIFERARGRCRSGRSTRLVGRSAMVAELRYCLGGRGVGIVRFDSRGCGRCGGMETVVVEDPEEGCGDLGWRRFRCQHDSSAEIGHSGGVEVLITAQGQDRKSTRLNSSHVRISYAVFC